MCSECLYAYTYKLVKTVQRPDTIQRHIKEIVICNTINTLYKLHIPNYKLSTSHDETAICTYTYISYKL